MYNILQIVTIIYWLIKFIARSRGEVEHPKQNKIPYPFLILLFVRVYNLIEAEFTGREHSKGVVDGVVLFVLRYDQRELPGSLLLHHLTEVMGGVDADPVFIGRGAVRVEDLLSLGLVHQQCDEFFVVSKIILQ